MKTKYLTLYAIVFTSWFYSCDFNLIKIRHEYPVHKDQISNIETPIGDTIHLIFFQEFNSDVVSIKKDGIEIFKKRIESKLPVCDTFNLINDKNSVFEFSINDKKSEPFELDSHYNCVVISWNAQKKELTVEYWIWSQMPGFE
jgi:hypothetical protein